MHGTVAASAKGDHLGEDRKPEHMFRGSEQQNLAIFGHPALYGDKVGDGRDGDHDLMCHNLGKKYLILRSVLSKLTKLPFLFSYIIPCIIIA